MTDYVGQGQAGWHRSECLIGGAVFDCDFVTPGRKILCHLEWCISNFNKLYFYLSCISKISFKYWVFFIHIFFNNEWLKVRNLNFHNLKHQSVRMENICTICRKGFTRKCSLKSHIESVHEGIKYDCHICHSKFSRRTHVQSHIKSAHEKVKHECSICGLKFTRKDNVQ